MPSEVIPGAPAPEPLMVFGDVKYTHDDLIGDSVLIDKGGYIQVTHNLPLDKGITLIADVLYDFPTKEESSRGECSLFHFADEQHTESGASKFDVG